MSRPILRTERLELMPMTATHLPLLHNLDSDPEVMRYLTGRARTASEIDAFWTPRCTDQTADALGLGWWVGFHHTAFVGWWALIVNAGDADKPPSRVTPEAGWRLRPEWWRQGLASEGAHALLQHAFQTVQVPAVRAETMTANHGSRAVMRKVGMRHVRTYFPEWADPLPGGEHGEVIYEVTSEEWRMPRP